MHILFILNYIAIYCASFLFISILREFSLRKEERTYKLIHSLLLLPTAVIIIFTYIRLSPLVGSSNTPLLLILDIFTLSCTAFLLMNIIEGFLFIKEKKRYHLLCWTILCFVSYMTIFIGDPFNILATLPFFLLGMCLSYQGTLLEKLSISIIIFPMCMSINAICDNIPLPFSASRVLKLFIWAAIWLVVHFRIPSIHQKLEKSLWLLFDLLALMPLLTILSVVVLPNTQGYFLRDNRFLYYSLLLISLITSLGLLKLVTLLKKHQMLMKEEALWKTNAAYYENIEMSQKQIRILRHDMANHLQTMSGLTPSALQDYLENLINSPALHSGRQYCKNTVINAVISGKEILMQELHIQTKLSLQLSEVLPFNDIDLCALFANGLDNAIEANQKLAADKRYLTLTAKAEKGLFMMHLKNPLSEIPITENRRILTSKTDKSNHGFGLESMSDIVKQYHGILNHTAVNGVFDLWISIPLSSS